MSGPTSRRTSVSVTQDWRGGWLAHGTADGVPFVAESDSESGALVEAAALVFDRHADRRMRKISARRRREENPC